MNNLFLVTADSLNNMAMAAGCIALLCLMLVTVLSLGKKFPGSSQTSFAIGALGVLIGVSSLAVAQRMLGFKVIAKAELVSSATVPDGTLSATDSGGADGMGGAPGGGGGRGGFTISPTRQLTTTVRKLALLTGNIQIELSKEKGVEVAEMLKAIMAKKSISDEDAEDMQKELVAKLSEGQLAGLDAISLPRQRGGSRGGSGGGGEAPENPFQEGAGAEAIKQIAMRFGVAVPTPAVAPVVAPAAKSQSEKSGK